MTAKLTEAQKRALSHLMKYPDQWRSDTPVTQKCLNCLRRKGLVEVAFDPRLGWYEMITAAGRIEAERLEKEGQDK